ncbi:5' nucleotidase, NT5C type [Clostridium sp. LBM24168]
MKNLSICIDIDGTITDPYYWLDSANRYFNKNVKPEEVIGYNVDRVMGVSRNEYLEFYERNKFQIHDAEPIREDASIIIRKLFDKNNIYFVTARGKDLEILTYHYLSRHGIPYDDVFVLGTTYKVDKARELQCDIFVEDSYENAVQLSKSGFKVLLIDTNYNRNPLNENIIRVFNWDEIYGVIEEMLLQGKAV